MLAHTHIVQIWEWFHQQYALIAETGEIPFIGQIGEAIYEDLSEGYFADLVESAIERGEHELYGLSRDKFFNWCYQNDFYFSSEEDAFPYYFIQLEMQKILAVYPYFIEGFPNDELFINELRCNYINSPLQEVW